MSRKLLWSSSIL